MAIKKLALRPFAASGSEKNFGRHQDRPLVQTIRRNEFLSTPAVTKTQHINF
jgi:hypothetical protein